MILVISILSELIMALSALYLIPMLNNDVYEAKHSRLIISLLSVIVISICFNTLFYISNSVIQVVILVLNYVKFIAAAVILYKKFNIKIVCLPLIAHSLCSTCIVGISFFVPMEQKNATYVSELSLLAVRIAFLLLNNIFQKQVRKVVFK